MSAPAPVRSGRPTARTARFVATIILVAVVALGCSNDSDSDDSAASTTTESETETTTETEAAASTTAAGDDGSTTTTAAGDDGSTTTTTVVDEPATTTQVTEPADPDAPPPKGYSGEIDGQDAGTSISFERGAEVSSVEIGGLEVSCEPIDNTGDTRTETVNLSFPDVEVGEDGSVEVAKPDDELSPSLTGVFAGDGTFTGSIFLSFERDGYACGGDYPVTASPS